MKKAAIIGIAIAIIVAGGLGIYAVSNTEGPVGDEALVEFEEEATATVAEDLGTEGDEFGFGEEATGSVEEDSGEKGDEFGFGESASVTVKNP